MTRDPAEGIDEHGHVRTGAARERVPATYEGLLGEAAERLAAACGEQLHSLYVYGSVATGQARPPGSDLDLLAVWRTPTPAAAAVAGAIAAELSQRHAHLVREVGLAQMSVADLDAPGDTGVGNRAFLRHYCVPIRGEDLRARLEPCAVGPALVRGFNGDLGVPLQTWLTELSAGSSGMPAAEVARVASRRLLLAAATTLSVRHGGWSTDRATAARLTQDHHPEWAADAATALHWCAMPAAGAAAPDHAAVQDVLAGFGRWIADGCR